MTAYRNFVEDFPRRCGQLLEIAGKPARFRGREVTLVLMVASAGLVIPYERLKSDGRWGDHPSGDRKTFADAAGKLEFLLSQPFRSSCLWTEANSTWYGGALDTVAGDPDSWNGLQKSRPISKDKKARTVLKVIRDALAHGNVWTRGNFIESIIFVKINVQNDKIVNYSFLSVAPPSFTEFLERWFDFLKHYNISQEVALEILKHAA